MWWRVGIILALIVGVPLAALCIVVSGDVQHEDDVWDFDPHLFDRKKP